MLTNRLIKKWDHTCENIGVGRDMTRVNPHCLYTCHVTTLMNILVYSG